VVPAASTRQPNRRPPNWPRLWARLGSPAFQPRGWQRFCREART